MKLTDILKREFIKVPLAGATKEECIANLIDILAASKLVTNRAKVLDEVLAREEIMTTGVGNGIAIPHCKNNSTQEFAVALGITENRIDFNAIDDNPVHIIFLLIGPDMQPGLHIKLLSRISRLMNKEALRNELLGLKSADDIFLLLQKEEEKFLEFE
jgi:fructose-specific phosphotransferase system IIA component